MFGRYWIIAPLIPRVAATYSSDCHPAAAQCSVLSECVYGIAGTSGIETAALSDPGA
jgi:hypothetical protein